jgi:excisionase family DNA binding protein
MRTLKIGGRKIRQYTVQDIMDKLEISKVTALNLIHSGRLKSVRIGRQHWINEDDLIDFILNNRGNRSEDFEEVLKRKVKNPIVRFFLKLVLKE